MAAAHRAIWRPMATTRRSGAPCRHRHRQSGFAIVAVLLLSLLIMLTSAFALAASLRARTFSGRSGTGQQALNVAEGGIDFALAALNSTIRDPAYAARQPLPSYFVPSSGNRWTYADGTNGYFFRNTFKGMVPTLTIAIPSAPPVPSAAANDYGSNYRIVSSKVMYQGVQKWVQAIVRLQTSKSPVDNAISGRAITARNDISPNGNSGAILSDSYDSRLGPYNAADRGSNGAVYAGGSILSGAVSYGSVSAAGTIDSRFSVSGSGNTATAGIAPLPIADAPPAPAATPCSWSRGDVIDAPDGTAFDLGDVTLSGHATLTLRAGRYVLSRLATSGNTAGLFIDNSAGPVEIYVTGTISVTGQGIVNPSASPTSLLLVATNPMAPVNIAGNGDFYGVVFAPANAVSIGGNGQFFGSVTGDSVTINGNNATVHYDEAIGATMVLPSTITMAANFQVLAIDLKNRL